MAELNRLAPFTARRILLVVGALEREYREISPDQVTWLLVYADQCRYPKPSNAAGPRGGNWARGFVASCRHRLAAILSTGLCEVQESEVQESIKHRSCN